MPPLSEIATNPDVVTLIVEQLGVADGLRLAAVSKSWRDSSRGVWGYAKTLVTTQRLLIQEDAALMSTPAFRNLQLLMMKETTNEARLDKPGGAIMLGDDLCVVDSSYAPKMRRVLVFSPELELKRTIPCPAPLVYPDSLDCPGEGVLTNVAASSEHLYVAWYSPAGYGLAAIYKYRLSDFELVGKCDPQHKVSNEYDGTEDEHMDWECYFHLPCDLAVHGERLFVCDMGGEFGDPGIVVFNLDMKHVVTLDGEHTLAGPEGMAVHPEGVIYVANSSADSEFAIAIFEDEKCRYMPCDGWPISIAFARGRILVGCASKDVKCFTPDGVLLQTLELGYMPSSLCVHDANRLVYVTDYSGANVKMLTYFNGEPEPSAAAGDDESGEAESVTEKLAREAFESLRRRRGAGFEITDEGAACAERCKALIDDILAELERQAEEIDSSDDD